MDRELGLVGLLSRRDLFSSTHLAAERVGEIVRGPCAVAFEDSTLEEASDLMARAGLGRLPVVKRDNPRKLVGILSSPDVGAGIRRRIEEADRITQTIRWR